MERNFVKYIHDFFKELIELHGFEIKSEINNETSYRLEYSSKDFVIKIEKYFREFYVSLYKLEDLDNEINLFNLLEYLKQGTSDVPKSEYFRKEKDVEECYRKQLKYISSVIYNNYAVIKEFFDEKYKSRMTDFEKYWKNQHPELYKTS